MLRVAVFLISFPIVGTAAIVGVISQTPTGIYTACLCIAGLGLLYTLAVKK